MSVAVLGAGAFGTALAAVLARDGEEVMLWGRDESTIAEISAKRTNSVYLGEIPLSPRIRVTTELSLAGAADIVLLAIPTQAISRFLEVKGSVVSARTVITCAKGLDLASGVGPVRVAETLWPERDIGLLTGPSFADELAKGLPTALTLAMRDGERAKAVSKSLSREGLRLYHSDDVVGAELGGALKNVVALAAGICIGAGLGENARAAVITRGFAEIMRLAREMGGRQETLTGLSGLGDLILTAMSEKSRNTRAGITIGSGGHVDPNVTVEGMATARALASNLGAIGVSAPVLSAVAAIVEGRLSVEEARDALLSRPLARE